MIKFVIKSCKQDLLRHQREQMLTLDHYSNVVSNMFEIFSLYTSQDVYDIK
jgi:aspartyl/asparaginyl beta-hydroxylase (cupin superfamily)